MEWRELPVKKMTGETPEVRSDKRRREESEKEKTRREERDEKER